MDTGSQAREQEQNDRPGTGSGTLRRDAAADLRVCEMASTDEGNSYSDSDFIDLACEALPHWIRRAQEAEARVMELENEAADAGAEARFYDRD